MSDLELSQDLTYCFTQIERSKRDASSKWTITTQGGLYSIEIEGAKKSITKIKDVPVTRLTETKMLSEIVGATKPYKSEKFSFHERYENPEIIQITILMGSHCLQADITKKQLQTPGYDVQGHVAAMLGSRDYAQEVQEVIAAFQVQP